MRDNIVDYNVMHIMTRRIINSVLQTYQYVVLYILALLNFCN